MENKNSRQQSIKRMIRNETICTFEKISKKTSISLITLRRDIKQIEAITSYTHSGRFITLPNIPCFDKNELWFFKGVGFSKFKNSLELVINIINNSTEGVSKQTLDEVLKIDVYKQIQILLSRDEISRIKSGSKYIYLPEELAKNKKKRLRLLNVDKVEEYYDARVASSDLIALLKAVLTEKKIKIGSKSLKYFAQKYLLRIPLKKIEQLLLKYNLPEKKTPSN